MIYPNPTDGVIRFIGLEDEGNMQVVIYDMQGKLIRAVTVSQSQPALDLTDMPAGVYILQILLDNGTVHAHQVVKI